MLRRHVAVLRLGLMAADGSSAVALFIAVSVVRFGSGWYEQWLPAGVDVRLLALAYGASWTAILWLFGLYRLRARWSARTEVVDVARSVLLLAGAPFVALFWLKVPNGTPQFL